MPLSKKLLKFYPKCLTFTWYSPGHGVKGPGRYLLLVMFVPIFWSEKVCISRKILQAKFCLVMNMCIGYKYL